MTPKSSSQSCAACKFQRRKCTPECLLAPYFPAHKPEVFKNVHRLFGVKKVIKTLEAIRDPSQRSEAMTSMIYQANMRQMFPALGCCHVIDLYYSQIHLHEEELHSVYAQLEFYRSQSLHGDDDQDLTTAPSKVELEMAPPDSATAPPLCHGSSPHLLAALPSAHQQQQYYPGGATIPAHNSTSSSSSCLDSKDTTPKPSMWIRSPYTNSDNDEYEEDFPVPQMGATTTSLQHLNTMHQKIIQEYEDLKHFAEPIGGEQLGTGSRGASKSSSDLTEQDAPQFPRQAAQRDLKSAAAWFSLTSAK